MIPALLAKIPDPPELLYCLGAFDEKARGAVAIVGSRRPSAYGARMARKLAREAAEAGLVVVSGLARGVDTEAHRAALEAGGVTWAVLGSGLDRIYPPENAALAQAIAAKGGCVASEYPPGTPPNAENFPRRNRLVSGLSDAIIVVEGTEKSGALITAKTAAEQGRDVLAVPGPADSELSRAPHILLRNGAGLVESIADVFEALPRLRPEKALPPAPSHKWEGEPSELYRLLKQEPRSLDELAGLMKRDMRDVSREIFELELAGAIVALGSQRYGLK